MPGLEVLPYIHPDNMTLSYAVSGSGAFVAINNLRTITFPEMSKGRVNVTSYSAVNRMARRRAGWLNPGEVKFTAYRDLTGQHTALFGAFKAETLLDWALTMNGGGGQTHFFTGIVMGVTPAGNLDRESDEEVFDEYTIVLTDQLPTYADPLGGTA